VGGEVKVSYLIKRRGYSTLVKCQKLCNFGLPFGCTEEGGKVINGQLKLLPVNKRFGYGFLGGALAFRLSVDSAKREEAFKPLLPLAVLL
jgi:hypothetical protein